MTPERKRLLKKVMGYVGLALFVLGIYLAAHGGYDFQRMEFTPR